MVRKGFVVTSYLSDNAVQSHIAKRSQEEGLKMVHIPGDKMYFASNSTGNAEIASINQLIRCDSQTVIFVVDIVLTQLLIKLGASQEQIDKSRNPVYSGRGQGQDGNGHVKIRVQINRDDCYPDNPEDKQQVKKAKMFSAWFKRIHEWRDEVVNGGGFQQDASGNLTAVRYTANSRPLGIDWTQSILEFSIDGDKVENERGQIYWPTTLLDLKGPAPYFVNINGSTSMADLKSTEEAESVLDIFDSESVSEAASSVTNEAEAANNATLDPTEF